MGLLCPVFPKTAQNLFCSPGWLAAGSSLVPGQQSSPTLLHRQRAPSVLGKGLGPSTIPRGCRLLGLRSEMFFCDMV